MVNLKRLFNVTIVISLLLSMGVLFIAQLVTAGNGEGEPEESTLYEAYGIETRAEPMEDLPYETSGMENKAEPIEALPYETSGMESKAEPMETLPCDTCGESSGLSVQPTHVVLEDLVPINQAVPIEEVEPEGDTGGELGGLSVEPVHMVLEDLVPINRAESMEKVGPEGDTGGELGGLSVEPVRILFEDLALTSQAEPVPEPTPSSLYWQTIKSENFEGAFPNDWDIRTYSGYADAYWGRDSYNPHSGSWSGFCAKSGSAGVNPPANYPNNMQTSMVYGPFSLADATNAEVNFYRWYKTESGYDYFWYLASIDGSDWHGWEASGDSGGWGYQSFDLTAVPTLGNVCGQPQVWILFGFTSDASVTYDGAFVDDVVLQKYVGPVAFDLEGVEVYLSTQAGDTNKDYVVDTPTVGQNVYFHYQWTCVGAGTTPTFRREMKLDGTMFCYGEGTVEGGYTYTRWCDSPWTATAGPHTATGVLDVYDDVSESNEANNEASKSWNTPQFDLEGVEVYLSTIPGDTGKTSVVTTPTVGQNVYFHYRWNCIGSGTTPSFRREMKLDETMFCYGEGTVDGGYSYTRWCDTPWTATAGPHTATGILDVYDDVLEWNETNNEASKSWDSGEPDIDVTPVHLDFECSLAESTPGYETPPSDDNIEMMLLDSPPTPPVNVSRAVVNTDHLSASAFILSDVPTSEWTDGCTATSAGMLFGYYDRTGYPNMYTGPTNGGVCPLTDLGQGDPTNLRYPIPGSCYIIATENGLDGISSNAHVDDYWISYGSAGPDPWEGNWPEHTWGLCTADFLGTNQWKWDYSSYPGTDGVKDTNTDGSTTLWTTGDGSKLYDWYPGPAYGTPTTSCCHGLRLFAESRGYTVETNYNQLTDNQHPSGFTFAEFQAEIDDGHPVLIQVTGHTMIGIGYETATNSIYIHDTWDNIVHSMTWGGSYAAMDMTAVTVIHLAPSGDNCQIITISNVGDGDLIVSDIEIGYQPDEPTGWLDAYPKSFTVLSGNSEPVNVCVDCTGLIADTYHGWLDIYSNDPDENPVRVTVTLSATDQYNLAISSTSGGSVTTPGEAGPYTYDEGTVVDLVATPDEGYRFDEWTGDVDTIADVYAASTNITMDDDYEITANFALISAYALTMAANPSGGGTATDLTDASPYLADTVVSIQAVAAVGYQFAEWSAPAGTFADANAAETTFTMPAQDVTVTANFASFAGGSGTEEDPYQIADWHHLDSVRYYPDAHFILINSLNSTTAGYTELASPTANGGKGWQPIGSLTPGHPQHPLPVDPFTGTFEGQGYEIRDLFINHPDEESGLGVGLFGAVVGGVIENVGVVDADVTGREGVGILVGGNGGTVSNCYSTGSVIFDDQFGTPTLNPDWVISPGKGNYSLTDNPGYLRYIIDAYGWPSGGDAVPLQLIRPFSGERWILTTAMTYNMRPAEPTNCRNMHVFIRTPGASGTTMAFTYRGVGLNDANPGSNWMGLYAGSNSLPVYLPNSPDPLPIDRWYFEIERNGDYIALRASNDSDDSTFEYEVDYTFPSGVLGNDQEIVIQGTGWYGSNDPPGYADSDFINVSTATGNVTGAGNVTGDYYVGGLVGYNWGTVDSSYATGSVDGSEEVGGLVGWNDGDVSNSYAIGSVAGSEAVGGLVGDNGGTVSNSYSTGSVSGVTDVGGLVGFDNGGTVSASFWDTETSGQATSAGGTGNTTAEMMDIDTFTSAGWDIIAVVDPDYLNTDYVWNIFDHMTYPFLSWQPANFVILYDLTTDSTVGGNVTTPGEGLFPDYDAGRVVDLVATPDFGYYFVNWTGDVGTIADVNAASTSITMNGDYSITANFALMSTYALTMAANPSGGGTATDLTDASPYLADTVVSIQAVAAAGYQFGKWSAPAGTFGSSTAATTTFTMPAQDVTVTANFASFAGGSGTEEDPYQIADWHHLDSVRYCRDAHFILINSLDSATTGYTEVASPAANGGKGWQPIGSIVYVDWVGYVGVDPFTGTFDGQGYEIRDLFINRPDELGVGLFGAVVGGVIENVGMVNADVTGYGGVGGLVGWNVGAVSDSYTTGSVTMVGSTWYSGVGGLVGENHGDVSNSYASGNVTGDWYAGGLVGVNEGNVDSSYATGSVTGNMHVGGLVGSNYGNVSNSYATGSVSSGQRVGGLVGYNNGTVSNSHATGNVDGADYVGGLVGENTDTVSNSFWDTETSGQATSAGGTGKTTAEMMDIDTFSGATWDIIAVANPNDRNTGYVWNIVADLTYPFLSWQSKPCDLTIDSTVGGNVTTPGEGLFPDYDDGTVVDLVATPDAGYRFVNWTGDVGTIADVNAATTTITMNGDYSITANFVATYDLTTSSTEGGSVTEPGQGTFAYDEGTMVELIAEADACYEFVNWTGDVDTIADVYAASTNITMDADKNVTANFALLSYNLTADSTDGGSITDPGEGTFTYDCGTVVSLNATPDAGFRFINWTGDVGTIANVNAASTTITMNGDYSITANFMKVYDLTISSTIGGDVTTPGEGTFTYDEGTVVDLVATPDAGYRFVNWTGDVGTIADVNAASTNITMNGDYSITANFVAVYDLTTSSTAGGGVTTPGEGTFAYEPGTVVDLVAISDEGYRFDEWTGDVGTVADVNAATTTITMYGDYSITANFVAVYDLSISSTEGGSVTTPGEGTFTYDEGTVVDLVAISSAGYGFDEWTGDVGTIADVNDATTTITMNGDYSVTANFVAVYDLSISSTEGGSVTTPGEAGPYTYDEGTVVNLVAEAVEGYHFVNWTGDVGSIADVNAAVTNITMNGDYSITANFVDTAPPTGYGCASPEDEAECVSVYEALVCSTASDDSAPIEYKFAIASDVAFSQDLQESGWQQSTNWTPTTALSYGTAYWWKVKARDAKNNESEWSSPFTFVTIYKFDLALKSGWNMISLPLESCTGETDPAVILPDVEVIYTWNCETTSYDSPSEIVPGKGYWALVLEDVTETIYGTPVEEYQLSSDCEGWHMVGSLYVDGQVNVGSGSVYGSLYHWNPETLSYIARPLDDARPGEGYWLLAFTDFSISVVPKPPVP